MGKTEEVEQAEPRKYPSSNSELERDRRRFWVDRFELKEFGKVPTIKPESALDYADRMLKEYDKKFNQS